MDIAAATKLAAERLSDSGIAESIREARSLVAHAIGRDSVFHFAHPEYHLTDDEQGRFISYLDRRSSREPLQYIVGHQEFYGLDFRVDPGVLIPRPETELIVDAAIKVLNRSPKPTFFEVGLGSGCISISILKSVPNAVAIATDVSAKALEIAAFNAEADRVADRLTAYRADLFGEIECGVDLIVSNPPYVPVGDLAAIQPEVGKFEPHDALFAGGDGLDVIRRLANEGAAHASDNGHLLIEVGQGQSESVQSLMRRNGWTVIEMLKDLQGIERVVYAAR